MIRREQWRNELASLPASSLVFLDETGAKTNMTRNYGRAPRGTRAGDDVPNGHWNTTTLIAAITLEGAQAPMVIDGATDTDVFATYLEQVLAPILRPGMIVVMDNLSSHKSPRIREIIAQQGATLCYLPPYSPDLNPIEMMWSKVKTALRAAKARTQEQLIDAIAAALRTITPNDASGWFKHCLVSMLN